MRFAVILGFFTVVFSLNSQAKPLMDRNCPQKPLAKKNHPLFKPYPNSTLCRSEYSRYDSFSYPQNGLVKKGRKEFLTQTVEGSVDQFNYLAPKGVGGVEIHRNFVDALKDAGFEILSENTKSNDKIGRFTAQLAFMKAFYPRHQRTGYNDCINTWYLKEEAPFYVSAFKKLPSGKSALLTMFARSGSKEHDECDNRSPYVITVVESAEMKMGQMKVDASAIGKSLDLNGKIALYGIKFDHNKAMIKPESEPELKEIAKFLRSRMKTNVYIVGHTDNTGKNEYNLSLSKKRAEAVVKALVKDHNISKNRLKAFGVGPFAPVGSNANEAGRSKNRRVELVLNQ